MVCVKSCFSANDCAGLIEFGRERAQMLVGRILHTVSICEGTQCGKCDAHVIERRMVLVERWPLLAGVD